MKLSILLAIFAITLSVQRIQAQGTNDPTVELNALVAKVNADIQAGKNTESDFSNDLKQFDALLAEHKGEKTDAVAQIMLMKAKLYLEVIGDSAKGHAVLNQLTNDFSGTELAKEIEQMADEAKAQEAQLKAIHDALKVKVGQQFPGFSVKDVAGNPLAVSDYKGKIVLVDFWATWCMPCREEIPNLVEAYKKYHDKGFDIIGVSLDSEKQKLLDFTSEAGMTWPEFFDGQGFNNVLAVKYGVEGIPANFLLDRNGKIIAENLRGQELTAAVADALQSK